MTTSSFHDTPTLTFADRHPTPQGHGQAPRFPDNARQCGRVEPGVTARPTLVINGVVHTLHPGWRWPVADDKE